MAKQVISIDRVGAVASLNVKGGVDVRKMGRANVVRSSIIEWSDRKQAYYVILKNTKMGRNIRLTVELMKDAGVVYDELDQSYFTTNDGRHHELPKGVVYFCEYDDAVKMEIAVIQGLRSIHGASYIK